MNYSIIERTEATTICIILFAGMIVFFLIGRRLKFYFKKTDEEEQKSSEWLQTALFALFGFILAFAFGMSGNRYENIRNVFIEEANDMSTAILRSDLYADSTRRIFRARFHDYLEARISLYSNIRDTGIFFQSQRKGLAAGNELWQLAIKESRKPNMIIPSNSMIPALNSMFDIATKREEMVRTSVPDHIIYMLLTMALVSSFIAGLVYSINKFKDWIITFCYFLFISLVVYITLDLGRPMRGLIKAERAEQTIVSLRAMFQ